MITRCQDPVKARETYLVRHIPDLAMKIDGILDEEGWQKADRHTRFSFPWRSQQVPPTEFRAFCNDKYLFFAFRVEDHDIVLQKPFKVKNDVAKEDRVEIFFTADRSLKEYWCLEIDPLGRVFDYRATYHRQFDCDWSCKGIKTAGKINSTGYIVEGSIPLQTFRELGLPEFNPGNELHIGLYRAEFSHTSNESIEEAWLSWIDPKTPEPDFHVPRSFGTFRVVGANQE